MNGRRAFLIAGSGKPRHGHEKHCPAARIEAAKKTSARGRNRAARTERKWKCSEAPFMGSPKNEIDIFKQDPNDWRCQNMWNGFKKLRQLCISSTQYDACTAYVHTIGINMPVTSPPDDAIISFWQPDQLNRIWALPASKCNWENYDPKTWHAVMFSSVHQSFTDAPAIRPMPIETDPTDPTDEPQQPDTQQPPDQPDHPGFLHDNQTQSICANIIDLKQAHCSFHSVAHQLACENRISKGSSRDKSGLRTRRLRSTPPETPDGALPRPLPKL